MEKTNVSKTKNGLKSITNKDIETFLRTIYTNEKSLSFDKLWNNFCSKNNILDEEKNNPIGKKMESLFLSFFTQTESLKQKIKIQIDSLNASVEEVKKLIKR